jgi:hypothetical protein
MKLISTIFVSALLLTSEASPSATTKSFVTCITKNGPKPVATVKTTSRILTVPFYGFRFTTTTPTRVTTPAPTTTTVTVTWTSVSTLTSTQETDTFSETITTTDTITTTSTDLTSVTSSNTVTVTLSPVTTLAAPVGFQPVRASIPNSVKRRSDNQSKDASNGSSLEKRAEGEITLFFKDGKAQCSPPVYPTAVTCAGIAKVITKSTITRTAKTKTVTASKPTSSVTTTTSFIRTTTLTPVRASTTLSFTTGTVITETQLQATTTTFSATQTVEVVQPSSTYYAACSSDNIISKVNGAFISNISYKGGIGGQSLQSLVTTSPYECCASCMSAPGCSGSMYLQKGSRCFLLIQPPGLCSLDAIAGQVLGQGQAEAYIVSNGLCGRYSASSFI